ncbi:DUF4169 family protein [Sinimarinibacterium sp. CAU 1509]|uniref:DUF4169 family protein n=1 Tax=Sinimarinibacterium sp. CAU 1509 TaxID=2562283 RepID=UPI0010AC3831|nr:DUF4169 family protein [Sinimarinibacterium sp. CAU 1509]TJY65006.1 DUF4169 family protein [Sinimarinibacterium sp. CAU 1509]
MAELINFNKARKRKAREQAKRQAAENRVRFGRTKAQKLHDAEVEAEAQRRLDGLRREPPAAAAAVDPSAQSSAEPDAEPRG